MTDGSGDPVATVDALVASIHPAVSGPGVETRDAVLVTGPWLAGSTSVISALGQRMPEQSFVEANELDSGESPVAVVFVASARAPLTDSDCALLDSAAVNTDLVIGAVSKIDEHPNWREVRDADRVALSEPDPRYRGVTWVGVAAAPGLSEPDVDELVEALRRGLADPQLARRNRLRAWQTRLRSALRRHDDDVAGVGREARVVALHEERSELLQHGEAAKSERTTGLHHRIEQAKVQLADFARNRCTSVSTELQEDASAMTRRRIPSFEDYVRGRVGEVVAEVNAGITRHLSDLATELGLTPPEAAQAPQSPPVSSPVLRPRGRQMRLMAVLGAVLGAALGFGVAYALTRLWVQTAAGPTPPAHLAPVYFAAGLAAGAVVGAGVAVWGVRSRGLRQDRSELRGWVDELIGELRVVLERHVGERVTSAEATLTAEQAEHDEADAAELADRIAGIDAELREYAVASHRAATLRSRELPPLRRALEAVQAELDGSAADTPAN